jgi:hypothetical protein
VFFDVAGLLHQATESSLGSIKRPPALHCLNWVDPVLAEGDTGNGTGDPVGASYRLVTALREAGLLKSDER